MKSLMSKCCSFYCQFTKGMDFLSPLFLLATRIWVAKIFFMSGLSKAKYMDGTVMLFQYDYTVPVLSPVVAAYLATFGELVFPVLLVLGLAGRFAALAVFIINAVAVASYPEISVAGINDHYFWGAMLAAVVFFGPGKLSFDHLMGKRCGHNH